MHRADAETYFTPDILPPAEASTAEAAALLGVDKKTVRKYIDAGLLEWRDIAPPGSSRPVFRIRKDSVLRLRTSYRTGPPTAAARTDTRRSPRRGPTALLPKLKHVTLRD